VEVGVRQVYGYVEVGVRQLYGYVEVGVRQVYGYVEVGVPDLGRPDISSSIRSIKMYSWA
jgi:hypothetical protein